MRLTRAAETNDQPLGGLLACPPVFRNESTIRYVRHMYTVPEVEAVVCVTAAGDPYRANSILMNPSSGSIRRFYRLLNSLDQPDSD